VQTVNDELQRADILALTDGLFGEASQTFLKTLAQARQSDPVKIALVNVGTDHAYSRAFANPVIQVDDFSMCASC
jgi:hypothetical protein